MVDTTTLIVISTVVQTIVISITLVIFILQFRSQEKAIKESSYQGLMGRYNDFISQLVDKPELAKLLMDRIPAGKSEGASREDAAIFSHLLMAYGIIEEAYLLYRKEWIDEETWQQWSAWLKSLSKNPMFQGITEATSGTFDSKFEAYVSTKILKDKDSG